MSVIGIRKSVLLFTTCLVFFFTMSFQVFAGGKDDDSMKTSSISLCLRDPVDNSLINGACFYLYEVAETGGVNEEESFCYKSAFQACGIELDLEEAELLARQLTTYAKENLLDPTDQKTTDDGRLCFSPLTKGLYLIVQEGSVSGYHPASPFLVSLPLVNADGSLTYEPEAFPKLARMTDPGPPVTDPTEPDLTPPEVTEPASGPEPTPSLETDPVPQPTKTDDPDLDQPRLIQTGQVNWPLPVMATAGFFLVTYAWPVFFNKKNNEDETAGADTNKVEAEDDDRES